MKEKIYKSALELFYQQGIKFTMDDLVAKLGISKRTLYKVINSKEQLANFVIEYYFDLLKAEQSAIRENKNISLIEKIKALLTAIPDITLERYRIEELRKGFPDAYDLLDKKLSTGWEKTFEVIEEAKKSGLIKDIDNELFSIIYSSALEGLMLNNEISRKYTFAQMQTRMVDMLIEGILK